MARRAAVYCRRDPAMAQSPPPKTRLAYIDWIRGLACLLMFQTHCYDSWLGGPARQSRFFMYSQLGGTFPAPLFLFVAGISFALVTERLRQKNLPPGQIARTTIMRGAEILGLGLLFRVQEFVISWGWAPKSDLLRVDILNTIGLSMMLMGVMCWMVNLWRQRSVGGPRRRGWAAPFKPVRSDRRGRHCAAHLAAHASSLDHVAPDWLAMAGRVLRRRCPQPGKTATLAFPRVSVDRVLVRGTGRRIPSAERVDAKSRSEAGFTALGIVGAALIVLSRWLDRLPVRIYPVYDYWHTSPEFLLIRVGMLMLILCGTYAWCRWGAGQWGFSPLIQLGQASLLVYWVHIEFVYGRVSILPKHSEGIAGATAVWP